MTASYFDAWKRGEDMAADGSLKFDTYREKGTQYLIIYDGDMTWNFYKEDGAARYVFVNQYGKRNRNTGKSF